MGRRAAGVAAVAAHGMCPAAPGCAWVHLLCASLSALPALLCLSRILRVLRVRQGRGQRCAPRPTRTRAALVPPSLSDAEATENSSVLRGGNPPGRTPLESVCRKTDVVQRWQPGANNSASDAPPLGRSMPVFACSSMLCNIQRTLSGKCVWAGPGVVYWGGMRGGRSHTHLPLSLSHTHYI